MPEVRVEETDEKIPKVNIACEMISFESNMHTKPYGNNSIAEGKLFESIKRFLAAGFKELTVREKKKKKRIVSDELEEEEELLVKKKKKKKKKKVLDGPVQDQFKAVRQEEKAKSKKVRTADGEKKLASTGKPVKKVRREDKDER